MILIYTYILYIHISNSNKENGLELVVKCVSEHFFLWVLIGFIWIYTLEIWFDLCFFMWMTDLMGVIIFL